MNLLVSPSPYLTKKNEITYAAVFIYDSRNKEFQEEKFMFFKSYENDLIAKKARERIWKNYQQALYNSLVNKTLAVEGENKVVDYLFVLLIEKITDAGPIYLTKSIATNKEYCFDTSSDLIEMLNSGKSIRYDLTPDNEVKLFLI